MIKQTKEIISSEYHDILKTIQYLCQIDRGSLFVPGLKKVASFLEEEYRKLGCSIFVDDDKEFGPTLVARKKGKGKVRIMLFAHMDTVWPEGTCATRPFCMDENYAYGPGVSDCTHGLITQLYVLKTLNELDVDSYGEVIIICNPDEELYSPHSKKWLKKYARFSDVALCMEGSGDINKYITARGGVIHYEIEVHGVKSHAGVRPEQGRNAIEELCHKVTLIHKLSLPDAIIQVTLIKGGMSEGLVPDYATAHVDIRVDTFDAIERIHSAMKEIESDTLIEGTKTICRHREGGCLPLLENQGVEKICKVVEDIGSEIGVPLYKSFNGGGADAWIPSYEGVPTLDGLVPVSYGAHTDEEKLALSAIIPRLTLVTELIRRISLDDGFLREGREDKLSEK